MNEEISSTRIRIIRYDNTYIIYSLSNQQYLDHEWNAIIGVFWSLELHTCPVQCPLVHCNHLNMNIRGWGFNISTGIILTASCLVISPLSFQEIISWCRDDSGSHLRMFFLLILTYFIMKSRFQMWIHTCQADSSGYQDNGVGFPTTLPS